MEAKNAIRNIQNDVILASKTDYSVTNLERIKSLQELRSRLYECFQIDTSL